MHMYKCLLSVLLFSPLTTLATPHRLPSESSTTQPSKPSYERQLQRPIILSPPSQHPIETPTAIPDEPSSSSVEETLNIRAHGQKKPISVTYTLSSKTCFPLVGKVPYIFSDLSKGMRRNWPLGNLASSHEDSLTSSPKTGSRQVYLSASIVEQIYRDKYEISLKSRFDPGSELKGEINWEEVIDAMEQSVHEVDKASMQKGDGGLGKGMVFEMPMEDVHVYAEYKIWKVVDGERVLCEN